MHARGRLCGAEMHLCVCVGRGEFGGVRIYLEDEVLIRALV